MKTSTEPKKDFDAVKYARQQKRRIYEKIKGMSVKEQLAYFKEKSHAFQNRLDAIE